ncbi:MAG: hypothetical protein A3A24_00335 [Candidatus Buchananbacteria bacterium RIFCSPLOWO2_01_FULL_46_12]|uniref:S1 motif domain-containing protein n=2 Tax=Candidatus Buchananiibacteriota TaxID=1817903 RepID=A0A1G1YP64_9BACT|nr:MAG: hypothetical protein A2744_00890 [Candidatus Buchananbacteria bacterium RIFCSPHIGHO2_01_FULL_44_11]OGY54152.1 MAG: hypothetical protein A3A24_00335 [Candidatus Buchananbacteria bacterium RIFCSPLOWO2_01_FULL_46_12]
MNHRNPQADDNGGNSSVIAAAVQAVAKIIKILVLRWDPNLETALFVALVTRYPRIARNLGITTGKLEFRFLSTLNNDRPQTKTRFEALCRELEITLEQIDQAAHFNQGGQGFPGWDSHGLPDGAVKCSLQVALDDHDFLEYRDYLRRVVEPIMANDSQAKALSKDPHNLREFATVLGELYPDNPRMVLEWLVIAFCGLFFQAKRGVKKDVIFNDRSILAGVEDYFADQVASGMNEVEADQKLRWFKQLGWEAIDRADAAWEEAEDAIKEAETKGRIAEVMVGSLGRTAKVIHVVTKAANCKVPPAARKAGYGVIIHWTGEHYTIHGNMLDCPDGIRRALDFGEIIAAIRRREVSFMQQRLSDQVDLRASGYVFALDSTRIPGFLNPQRNIAASRTRSSPDSPQTNFKDRQRFFQIVCEATQRCAAIDKGPVTNGHKPTSAPPRTQPTPTVEIVPGMIIEGKIRNITPIGAFVRVTPDQDGLVYIGEASIDRVEYDNGVLKVGNEVLMKVGDIIRAKVVKIGPDPKDPSKVRVSLSSKFIMGEEPAVPSALCRIGEVPPPPEPKPKIGTVFEGKVTRIGDISAAVQVSGAMEGMVRITELDVEYVESVGDVVQVGDVIKVKVVDIDAMGKIWLSRKAIMLDERAATAV